MPRLIEETRRTAPPARTAAAPAYDVPQNRIVSVEHPCVVRNFENAVKSLGGEPQIKHVLEHAIGDSNLNLERSFEEPKLGVSLRPHDPFSKKISSNGVETRNVLVKVTLPKRTGRKRKRGSDEPWTESDGPSSRSESITAHDLLQRLKEAEGRYKIDAVGTVNETHRFRDMPDFQLKASDNTMMREMAAHVMRPSYDVLKALQIDLTPGAAHITSLPAPPNFMTAAQPHRYRYEQAAGVVIERDAEGKKVLNNVQAPLRRVVVQVPPDCPTIPTGPPPELKLNHSNGTHVREAVARLRVLLDERPLLTRRYAMNIIPHYSETVFKEATEWVGYSFRAGPWANSLIRYGVDPRSDPKYRIYQTLNFQLDKNAFQNNGGNAWSRGLRFVPDGQANHIFDGKHISVNGKTWQICDIKDPVLAKLFATDDRPTECDVFQHGWYHNGTMGKARAIMRDKIDCLLQDVEPHDEDYAQIVALANNITHDGMASAYVANGASLKAVELAGKVRSMARTSRKNIVARIKELKRREKDKASAKGKQTQGVGTSGSPSNPVVADPQDGEGAPEDLEMDVDDNDAEGDDDDDNGLGDDDVDNDFDAEVDEEDEDAEGTLQGANGMQEGGEGG